MQPELVIRNLENKNIKFAFVPQNTQGIVLGSMLHFYNVALELQMLGYEVVMFCEQKYDKSWLPSSFANIKHIEWGSQEITVSASDFIVVPEYYVQHFYQQLQEAKIKLPCEIVPFVNNIDLVTHTMDIATEWRMFGVKNVLCNGMNTKDYIDFVMNGLNTYIVNPKIHSSFRNVRNTTYKKPQIVMFGRNGNMLKRIVKEFYLLNPQFRYFSFLIVNQKLSQLELAAKLGESAVAVWLDEDSSFGTFPLEALSSGVPVIASTPDLKPEWYDDFDIIWVDNKQKLIAQLSDFITAFTTNAEPEVKDYEKVDLKYGALPFKTNLENAINSIIDFRIKHIKNLIQVQEQTN